MPPDRAVPEELAAPILADAAALGIALDQRKAKQLERHLALLKRWNSVHNLTAIESSQQAITQHVIDSLSILAELDRFASDRTIRLLDVGSGGGLPGIPIAIVRPSWRIDVVDKIGKKVAFLTQAKLELELANVEPIHSRVEQLAASEAYDVILSRAFGTLADFVEATRHLLAPAGAWFAMKGARPIDEMNALARLVPPVDIARAVKLDVPRSKAERHLFVIQPR